MTRKKRGRKKRNKGWFKKGTDARRHQGFTREACQRGYQATLAKISNSWQLSAWFYYLIRGFYRAQRREQHGEEENGRRSAGRERHDHGNGATSGDAPSSS